MTIKRICDGCDKVLTGEFYELGYVIQREYCGECSHVAVEFIGELDAMHDRCAKEFAESFAAIRETYVSKLASLPDYAP